MCVGEAVVEVAVGGGHATAGEHTVGVVGLDFSALAGGGASSGDAVVDDLAGVGVGDGVAPFGSGLLLGDLAGDVGDDGPVAGEFSGVVVELGEGGEVDVDVDYSGTAGGLVGAVEEVEEDVGAELVHAAGFGFGSEALGELIDTPGDGGDPVGWEIEPQEVSW